MTFAKNDQELLDAVGGELGESAEAWCFLKRGDSLLLALPDDQRFRQGLSIYQPQSLKARLMVGLLHYGGPLGRRLAPLERGDWGAGNWLEDLKSTRKEKVLAVLFGNASQASRRVVIFTEKEGELRVWKVGFGEEARKAIYREVEVFRALPDDLTGVPALLEHFTNESCEALCLPFIDGKSLGVEELDEVTSLLTSWLGGTPIPALEFPELTQVASDLKADDQAALEQLVIRPTLMHGDLAPWNVLRNSQGEIQAIDWEMAVVDQGVPGWDLLHFLLQDAILLKGMSGAETLSLVPSQLKMKGCQNYLNQAGWGNRHTLLLSTYLSHTACGEHFDFQEVYKAMC